MRRPLTAFVGAVALAAGTLAFPPAALAGSPACGARVNNTFSKLLECVTLAGVREHQAALQLIAEQNGGNRFSGLPGHDASVDYVVQRLIDAGYTPRVQSFDYLASAVLGPSTLRQTAPGSVTYTEDTDYTLMDQVDQGDVTAPVSAVDLQLGLGNTSTSGCEAADFAGFPAGSIALFQRGTCTFELKAENAAAAGAVGFVVFNQGNTAERTGLANVTLGATNESGIPGFFATYGRGVEWAGTAGLVLNMVTDVVRETKTTYNVLAETPGRADNVVMVGAHLDSVSEGPGINDNGSGSAAILEVAEQMAKVKPRNQVRFAWWGAEESGLVGSRYYVNGLGDADRAKIALYLNFDMIGSPNYVRFVYDGSGDAFGLAGPPGSAQIEQLFVDFYGDRGLASEPTEISFRSDYAGFFEFGIPFGGLFTGAEGIKTAAQAATSGGTAGLAYDPCYHQACDTYANNDDGVLDVNADAVAYATLQYAMSTETINGRRGKGNFTAPASENLGSRKAS